MSVSEEVKGFRVYLMDDKKVVNTQHDKYIETLPRTQNSSLLHSVEGSVDGDSDNTGPSTYVTGSRPGVGAIQP